MVTKWRLGTSKTYYFQTVFLSFAQLQHTSGECFHPWSQSAQLILAQTAWLALSDSLKAEEYLYNANWCQAIFANMYTIDFIYSWNWTELLVMYDVRIYFKTQTFICRTCYFRYWCIAVDQNLHFGSESTVLCNTNKVLVTTIRIRSWRVKCSLGKDTSKIGSIECG